MNALPIYKYDIGGAAPLYYFRRRNCRKEYLTAFEVAKRLNSTTGRYYLVDLTKDRN